MKRLAILSVLALGACSARERIQIPGALSPPTDLAQASALGLALSEGTQTCTEPVILQGRVSSPKSAMVRLEVEVRPVGSAPSGVGTHASELRSHRAHLRAFHPHAPVGRVTVNTGPTPYEKGVSS